MFNFRENDYNSAVNTHFWARSKFNSIANFDPLMANDGSLESFAKESSFWAFLQGADTITKILI